MTENLQSIGVDIGGSHLTACLVDEETGRPVEGSERRAKVNSRGSAPDVLRQWMEPICEAIACAQPGYVKGVGVAIPGPFDYEEGVSRIRGLGKYDRLYGMNLREEFRTRLNLPDGAPIVFENDAGCFALGEAIASQSGARRIIGVTLGTGLGSGFVADGRLQKEGVGVPKDGYLYRREWKGVRAEDAFSGRGLRGLHKERTGEKYKSAALLAKDAETNADARATWEEYGDRLGQFVGDWAAAFEAGEVVFGGSIVGAWNLFGPALTNAVQAAQEDCIVRPSASPEHAAMAGAARLVFQRDSALRDG